MNDYPQHQKTHPYVYECVFKTSNHDTPRNVIPSCFLYLKIKASRKARFHRSYRGQDYPGDQVQYIFCTPAARVVIHNILYDFNIFVVCSINQILVGCTWRLSLDHCGMHCRLKHDSHHLGCSKGPHQRFLH